MAGKDDFTEQEWETMQRGVTGSGMLVSVADRGFFDTFKEVGALSKYLKQAREKSSSELVKQLAEVRGTGFGLTDSPDEVESKTVEALRSSMTTLKAKAPDEAEAYSKFVLDVGYPAVKSIAVVFSIRSWPPSRTAAAFASTHPSMTAFGNHRLKVCPIRIDRRRMYRFHRPN